MTAEGRGMLILGVVALVAGAFQVWPRFRTASGTDRILVLGPVFEAAALAAFGAEHLLGARDLMPLVPRWMPWPLFWTYVVGAALLAAALSFLAWRCVRWSALLLALLFSIFVVTIDLPALFLNLHDRFAWTLTLREAVFASGALVLAVSAGGIKGGADRVLAVIGRSIVATTLVFYAVEHFRFPRNVPGVPLELLTPAWISAPRIIAYSVGAALLLGGIGLFIRPAIRIASAGCGGLLLLLTAFFYVPILATEIHTAQAVDGLNYVYDTMLFASTVLLAGFPGLVAQAHSSQSTELLNPVSFSVPPAS
ncbi:MAG: hypothetical protein ACLGPM_01755 [Acidobacteriota bacterium]